MRGTLKAVTRVKSVTEALTETEGLAEEQAELAAGIRELGNPELSELVASLEESVARVERLLSAIQERKVVSKTEMEEVDVIALKRIRDGAMTGETSIEDFATEFGVDSTASR